jgi:hypothetical protein
VIVMDDEMPTLESFAWIVLTMRDAQKRFEEHGSPLLGHLMRDAESLVDEMVSRICLPPLPFEQKGDQQ